MSSLQQLNTNAEVMGRGMSLRINTEAAKGLQAVLKTNLGPRGTLKCLVGGAGQLKLSKDGSCLLSEMQIQHPTALLIARAATATDDTVGDGTSTTVIFCGELLKQAERYLTDGLHPRVIVDGFDEAKRIAGEVLEEFKRPFPEMLKDRELLTSVCRTTLGTKLRPELVGPLTEIVTDAFLIIRQEGKVGPSGKITNIVDLHMVEIMHMAHRMDIESRLVKGLVLDHGARHPDMPRRVKNAYILTCNVSLEYEKSEVAAGFFYKTAEERERMVAAERKFVDDKVKQIVEFKRHVCTPENGRSFVVLNQKGIDPASLDMFAREGILALRRAKRRNMERLTLACGGVQVNSVEDLTEDVLGFADEVYEVSLGEEKYTFVEGCRNPQSCTILIKGQNPHTIAQMKDAIRDGLRSLKNAVDDLSLVPGAGAFEIACHHRLMRAAAEGEQEVREGGGENGKVVGVKGKAKLGVRAFAEAMMIVPKTLAENSGLDVLDTTIKLQEAYASAAAKDPNAAVGLDLYTGEPIAPAVLGIWDNTSVKRSTLNLAANLASQLLLVDEIMRAGRGSRPSGGGGEDGGMEE